jgi:glycosyltransferase involved in cell wall biosynthesis
MEKYLPKFLEWLPKQTFFDNLEVVLDHNEPTEQEIHSVKDFQEKYPGRIKHIIVEKVDPIGTSMNRCIREASGDFVAIWNVDDLRTSYSIEVQARLLLENPHLDSVYGNFRIVRSFTSSKGKLVDCSQFPESELTRSMILGPFFMFRKSLCSKAGFFDEQLRSGADFDFAIRLVFHGQAQMVQEELGYYLNEGLGASTCLNSLQPIERTVIELRYGIYDKIDYHYLPQALKYNIYHLKLGDQWIPIEDFVPNYAEMMSERYRLWFDKGLKNQLGIMKKEKEIMRPWLHKIKSVISQNK